MIKRISLSVIGNSNILNLNKSINRSRIEFLKRTDDENDDNKSKISNSRNNSENNSNNSSVYEENSETDSEKEE